MLIIGVAGAVLAGGNIILLGFSGLLILLGLLIAVVAEIVRWFQSHGIFRPQETYGGLTATQRGETVRSSSERRIADYFYQNKIRLECEQVIAWFLGLCALGSLSLARDPVDIVNLIPCHLPKDN